MYVCMCVYIYIYIYIYVYVYSYYILADALELPHDGLAVGPGAGLYRV